MLKLMKRRIKFIEKGAHPAISPLPRAVPGSFPFQEFCIESFIENIIRQHELTKNDPAAKPGR